jgi:hypothetical protein
MYFYFFSENILHQMTIFHLIIISLISSFSKELIFIPTPYIFFYLSSEISGLEIIPVFYFFFSFPSPLSFFVLTHITHNNHNTWTGSTQPCCPNAELVSPTHHRSFFLLLYTTKSSRGDFSQSKLTPTQIHSLILG